MAIQQAFLSTRDVMSIYGVSYTTVWRWVRDGYLPEPIKVGPRQNRNAWSREVINAHVTQILGDKKEAETA